MVKFQYFFHFVPPLNFDFPVCQTGFAFISSTRERSRENQKERLQYLAAGTAGTTAPQKAGYGAITSKAAGLSTSAPPPCFELLLDR